MDCHVRCFRVLALAWVVSFGLPLTLSPGCAGPEEPVKPAATQSRIPQPETRPQVTPTAEQLHAALKAANPEYKGGGKFTIKDGRLISISVMRCRKVSDLSPLAKFPLESVASLTLYGARQISDLSPMAGCRLVHLNVERCAKITDLSPLAGMPIEWARMYGCTGLTDLSPLKGMPLKHLDIGLCPNIRDISVLKGMPITDLRIDQCPGITDISAIKGMPLKFLTLFGNSGIKSFAPLERLQLETLVISPEMLTAEEIQTVRDMKSLKTIDINWDRWPKMEDSRRFWQRYDTGEFRKK